MLSENAIDLFLAIYLALISTGATRWICAMAVRQAMLMRFVPKLPKGPKG